MKYSPRNGTTSKKINQTNWFSYHTNKSFINSWELNYACPENNSVEFVTVRASDVMSQNHTLSHSSCITKHFSTSCLSGALSDYSKCLFFKIWRYIVLSQHLNELFTQFGMKVQLKKQIGCTHLSMLLRTSLGTDRCPCWTKLGRKNLKNRCLRSSQCHQGDAHVPTGAGKSTSF